MEVFFYKFSKYPNSTKLPSDDQKIIFTGRLRDNSSIINPIISFQEINGNIDRNYAYIPEFNRYYFVTDWVYNPPLWVAHMKVDVLASYKTEIGNANEYVLRSSYTSDGTITDRNYPATTVENIIVNTGSITPAWAAETLTEGTYVVGVLSAGINYYLMDITALQEFLTWVASDDAAEELVGDFQTAFPELKAVANLKQYINSICHQYYHHLVLYFFLHHK